MPPPAVPAADDPAPDDPAAARPLARGRPRSAAARAAVLAAAFELLAERGYAGLTMEGVAARAGVAKTTVYRGWPDRAALAADAFLEGTRDLLAFPSTGSAREDFRGQIHAVAALLRGPVGAAIAGMAAGAREDPAVGRALGERWLGPRQRWGAERLRRAQAAGESPPDLDVPGALAALYGPLYAALLLGLGPPTRAQVDGYLGVVFAAVFPGGGGGGGGGR